MNDKKPSEPSKNDTIGRLLRWFDLLPWWGKVMAVVGAIIIAIAVGALIDTWVSDTFPGNERRPLLRR